MPVFEIKLKMPELPKTIAAFEEEPALRLAMVNDTLRACDKILTPAIKAETPVISGKLQKSTHHRITSSGGDQVLEITQNAKTKRGVSYGIFVREGTKPHEIRPRDVKALHFFIGGREVFVMKVHHPGTKPNDYPQRAYEKVSGEIDNTVAKVNQMTAGRLAGGK